VVAAAAGARGARIANARGAQGATIPGGQSRRRPGPTGTIPASAPSGSRPDRRPRRQGRRGGRRQAGTGTVDGYAGFALSVLAWSWVALPYLRGGVAEVRDVLRAKFTNRDSQGRWLP
jgi:hypothetical protein